jgi:hypothetical protein
MTTRKYSSRAQQTTLSSSITSVDTTMTVGSASNLMASVTPTGGETYTVVIDPDTAVEEIVDVTEVAGSILTIVRGVDNAGTGVAHSAGAIVRHMVIGRDLNEANAHSVGTLAEHAATTSLELKTLISDETGSGSLVFATSPTLVTPVLGVATATSINGTTIPSSATLVKTSDTGTVDSTMILDGTILNADVNASADIAYSKLNLVGGIVSADIANDTIVNADINTAAAIAWTKIAPSSTVSEVELGYVAGVTSAIQAQIDAKLATATAASTYAPLASPALTGIPTAPTAAADTNTTQIATTAYVQTELTDLIGGAPGALDTLNELAAALADDASYSTTITTALAGKLPLAGGTMTGAIAMGTSKITDMGTPTLSTDAATKGYVDGVTVAPSNLTGPITSVGSATSIASQTGTGTKFVVDTSPTLVTPVLGVATATSINGTTIPSTKTLIVTTDTLAVHAATTSAQLAGVISDETGSGSLVFATSPTLVTPNLGTPSAINLTNATAVPTDATKANLASPTFTGTVTIPTGAVITSPKIASTYSAKTAAYTFVSGDEGQLFSMNNAASVQFNIPTDATFNFAVGTEINVFWITGAGQPTIGAVTPGTTTVISTGATSATPKLRVANSGATIKKLAANSWIVFGDLA